MTWQAALAGFLKALLAGFWGFLEKRKLQNTVNELQEEKRDKAVEAATGFKETVKAVLDEKPAQDDDAGIVAARERLRARAAGAGSGTAKRP